MVFEDLNISGNSIEADSKKIRQNRRSPDVALLDRLGAFIIDIFIVLPPLVALVTAPLKKTMTASSLFHDEISFNFILAIGIFLVFLLTFFYQYLCLIYLQGSVGKRMFALRVEGIFEKKLTLGQCFSRALIWPLSPITLGLSCLGLLSDPHRRAVHDRWADTKVVSLRYRVRPPSNQEIWLARGVQGVLFSLFALMAFVASYHVYLQISNGSYLQSLMETEGKLCPEVGSFYKDIQANNVKADRLNAAFTMYNLGNLKASCLSKEVEFVFSYLEVTDLAYLVKSVLVESTNPKLSTIYRERLCENMKNSRECLVGKFLSFSEEQRWTLAEEQLNQILDDQIPLYLVPLAIDLKLLMGAEEEVLDLLVNLPSTKVFQSYTAKTKGKIRMQALFNNPEKQKLIQDSLEDLSTILSHSESFQLNLWMCYQSYQKNCEAQETRSCQFIDRMVEKSPQVLAKEPLGVIWVKKHICNLDNKVLHKELLKRTEQKLLEALLEARTDRLQARSKLLELSSNFRIHFSITSEATRNYIKLSHSAEELKPIAIAWELWEPTFEWKIIGQKLINKFYQYKDYSSTIFVAEQMKEKANMPKEFQKKLFISYYKENRILKAKKMLSDFRVRERGIASTENSLEISKKIQKKLKAYPYQEGETQ